MLGIYILRKKMLYFSLVWYKCCKICFIKRESLYMYQLTGIFVASSTSHTDQGLWIGGGGVVRNGNVVFSVANESYVPC